MASEEESAVKEPLDLIRLSLDERICVKLRSDCELRGKLHISWVLADESNRFTKGRFQPTVEIDDQTYEEITTTRRTVPFLFVRGDGVMLVSHPPRTT